MRHLRKSFVASTALAFALGAALAAGLARAEPPTLELIAYLDRPGGREIVEARYYEAIDLAEAQVEKPNATHRLVAYTNLCVARTKIGNFAAAKEACDMAVNLAEKVDRSADPRRLVQPMPTLARALSNRGVLLFMLGDASAAMADFAEARTLDRTAWNTPERNMAYVTSVAPDAIAVASSGE